MKILLRLALLALCSAAGILLAVKLASSQPKPATTPDVAATPAASELADKSDDKVAATVVEKPVERPTAAVEITKPTETPAPALSLESEPKKVVLRTTGAFTPKLPRKQPLQPRVTQQIPGTGSAGGSSGNSIADSERMLMQVQQQIQQTRDNHKAALQQIGASPNSDPAALMSQILGQGGLPGNAPDGAAPAAEQLNQLLKAVQGTGQNNAAAQIAPPPGAPGPALPGLAQPGAAVPAVPEVEDRKSVV